MAKAKTLEEAFEGLEECVSKLEAGNLPLEEAFKLYNEGIKLVSQGSAMLDKVEKQIVVIGEGNDGV